MGGEYIKEILTELDKNITVLQGTFYAIEKTDKRAEGMTDEVLKWKDLIHKGLQKISEPSIDIDDWWKGKGSAIVPKRNDDFETHAHNVINEFILYFKEYINNTIEEAYNLGRNEEYSQSPLTGKEVSEKWNDEEFKIKTRKIYY